MTDLISILIPTYNSRRYLHRALDSALGQTYPAVEVVLVDNASTDDTFAIAGGYAARDPRLRVYRNERNLGPVANWRRCVEQARGAFATLLFSDDWIEPDFVGTLLPPLADPEVGFSFSAVQFELVDLVEARERRGAPAGGSGEIAYGLPFDGKQRIERFVEGQLYAGIFPDRPAMPVSLGCSICRTADLRRGLDVRLPDPLGVEFEAHGGGPDLIVNLFNALQYPAFHYSAKPLTHYLYHPTHLGSQRRAQRGWVLAREYMLEQTDIARLCDVRKAYTGLFWALAQKGLARHYLTLQRRPPLHRLHWFRLPPFLVRAALAHARHLRRLRAAARGP
jgi:glycosyltransferase involved in cell wall biosynthesis